MLNPSTDMTSSQGLSKDKEYEGVVVNNNDYAYDKRRLGRVQIRVAGIFDGIPDEHLPWAITKHGSSDGASENSGKFSVPAIGSKVLVRFQNGSASHPIYSAYVMDEKTFLKEAEVNYPNRDVTKLKNGCLVIVDKQTNEIFIRNPGAANIYIQGDVNLTVTGNLLEEVKGDKTLNVAGNYIEKIGGNHLAQIQGQESGTVGGSRHWSIGGSDTSD